MKQSKAKSGANSSNPRKRRARALNEPGWCGYWKIGVGGAFGPADLWVKQNTHGKIIDRVIVKDSCLGEETWNDPSLWVDGLRDQDAAGVPTEIQSLYNLRPRIGLSSVLRIRSWRIQREQHLHTTYTEFCPWAEARNLVKFENIYGKHPSFRNKKKDVSSEGSLVPEPLLWSVFETLTRACLPMER